MPAPFVIPFNFTPTSSARGTTASYTVPAGKYAKVTFTVNHSFFPSQSLTSSAGRIPSVVSQVIFGTGGSTVVDVWMRTGEILNLATTNTNGTATVTGNGSSAVAQIINASANISTAITVNSVLWRNIVSRAAYSAAVSIPVLSQFETCALTSNVTCESSFGWWAQEYNTIS